MVQREAAAVVVGRATRARWGRRDVRQRWRWLRVPSVVDIVRLSPSCCGIQHHDDEQQRQIQYAGLEQGAGVGARCGEGWGFENSREADGVDEIAEPRRSAATA